MTVIRRFFLSKKVLLLLLLYLLCISPLFAQDFSHKSWEYKPEPYGKWYQLETTHFIVYYEKKDKDIATEVAQLGDAFFKDYSAILKYNKPKIKQKKVRVIINSRSQQTNGYYDNNPPRIVLYTQTAMLDEKGSDWYYFLLSHELLHYMQLEYPGGLAGTLRRVFGPAAGTINSIFSPGWTLEGFAVAVESDYTSAGRLHHPIFTMPVRADVLLGNKNGYLKNTRNILENEQADYSSRYTYGAEFMSYIVHTYGYEAFFDAWKNFTKFPLGYSHRLKKTTGKNFYELQEDMYQSLTKKYTKYSLWPRGEELPNKDRNNSVISVQNSSKEGSLVFKSVADKKPELLLYSSSNNTYKKLFTSHIQSNLFSERSAYISKDGRYVVYSKELLNVDRMGISDFNNYYTDVFVYDIEKKKHTRVTHKQHISLPVFDTQNKYIYATQSLPKDSTETRLIRFSMENPKDGYEVIFEQDDSVISSKAISPDNNKIAFVQRSQETGIALKILNLQTGNVEVLIQRDNRLWINNLNFEDNNTLSFSGDIEEPGIISQFYTVHLDENGNQTWTMIAKDKVGIATAALLDNGDLLYSSHNSEANSLYLYKASNLENVTVNINEIEIPKILDNQFQIYANKNTMQNPSEALQITNPNFEISPSESKRIHPAIPSRLIIAYPYFVLASPNKDIPLTLGYATELVGKTDASYFAGSAAYDFSGSDGYLYDLAYKNNLFNQGLISFNTLRDRVSLEDDYYRTRYSNDVSFTRPLLATPKGLYLLTELSTTLYNDRFSTNLDYDDKSASLDYFLGAVAFPFYWQQDNNAFLKNPLSWGVSPSVEYSPPILSITESVVNIKNASYLQVPFGKYIATKVSNYSSLYSNINIINNTERFRRFTSQTDLAGTNFFHDENGTNKAFQSSFAFDFYVNFGNLQRLPGSYIFQVFNAYSNFFVEQTIGANTESFEINDYTLIGNETGMQIAIYSIPLFASIGTIFKTPHSSSSDFVPYVYFAFGGSGSRSVDSHGLQMNSKIFQ